MEHSLSFSRVRGQGYDGASNMQGAINGLKTLILNESPSAHCVHCFTHQLQLTLVAVAKKNADCELESGSGLNQELSLSRPGDTRWGSHFKTILNVLNLYPTILESLDAIGDVSDSVDRNRAESLTHLLMSFDFIFVAHLMKSIFAITNELNLALQRSDQDIVNAMKMVDVTKINLQNLRNDGWDIHMSKVTLFAIKYGIETPDMEEKYVLPDRRKFHGNRSQVTNLHHFRVEVFLSVIDLQLQELENRFNEVSKELLVCMSSFNPANQFSAFDIAKLTRLAEFYPTEFSTVELSFMEDSLQNFIVDIRSDGRFSMLKNLIELSMKLVETGKHETHSRVYLLLKLVLLLPVATASVERVFSGMNTIKSKLRSTMGDQLLNDCLVTYIEKDLFLKVRLDDIVAQFQNMKTRREQL
ncbi:uncharacterized protein LOC125493812 [Beta vulgaris subsp. vulgaris]|uniref:uncharacterized protein LOC125493812 n=1 Tax=Beta vulgaris subsp. vulgaris TaxID=3555 RepID=UPI002036E5BE|nr:uncharacterized protein LOC125493812 [Beta vulgaris subsp. vulgaris]